MRFYIFRLLWTSLFTNTFEGMSIPRPLPESHESEAAGLGGHALFALRERFAPFFPDGSFVFRRRFRRFLEWWWWWSSPFLRVQQKKHIFFFSKAFFL